MLILPGPFRGALRHLAGLAGLAALAAGCYWSLRLAWADRLFRLDTESSVTHAARLVPANAEYHARLAELLEDGGGGDAAIESELHQAVAANPRLASAWMELGLRAESAGDLARAEACLLRAAQSDRMYVPLWTLANYYFRRNDKENFWPVARRALRIGDVGAYDPAPLFRLCWKVSRNPSTVLERAIPDIGAVEARYLEFLVRENLAPVAEPVTERVVALSGERDLGAVLEYCDRLIPADEAEQAVRAWNALCWRTLHGYRPLAPHDGLSLTNGDFSSAPIQHGFDWRMPVVAGVVAERGGLPPRLWITLDGHEPESCDVLEQYLALEPSRRYRLRFRYQTDGIAAGSGLRWRISDVAAQNEIAAGPADLASEQETGATMRFAAPPGVHLARLALAYRRSPGMARIDGRVALAAISLEFDP
jgi:tetratricopeptide (TPR) repeat protein